MNITIKYPQTDMQKFEQMDRDIMDTADLLKPRIRDEILCLIAEVGMKSIMIAALSNTTRILALYLTGNERLAMGCMCLIIAAGLLVLLLTPSQIETPAIRNAYRLHGCHAVLAELCTASKEIERLKENGNKISCNIYYTRKKDAIVMVENVTEKKYYFPNMSKYISFHEKEGTEELIMDFTNMDRILDAK